MRRGVALAASALLPLVLACVAAGPAPEPARLSVEVERGAARRPSVPLPELFAIVDLRVPRGSSDAELLAAATRRAARRYLAAQRPGRPVTLLALGEGPGEACGRPDGLGDPADRTATEWAEALGDLLLAPPGSLGGALELLAEHRAQRTAAGPRAGRVVIFSPLPSRCARDLCAPAAALAAQGTEFDLVVLGAAEPPACLTEIAARRVPGGPYPSIEPLPPARVAFFVEPRGGQEGYYRDERYVPVAVEGRTGEPPIEVAPGLVEVQLALDSPLRVFPIRLAPGRTTRIRILDFPTLGVRRTFVETERKRRSLLDPRRYR